MLVLALLEGRPVPASGSEGGISISRAFESKDFIFGGPLNSGFSGFSRPLSFGRVALIAACFRGEFEGSEFVLSAKILERSAFYDVGIK